MPTVVPVRFTYANKDFWFDAEHVSLSMGDHVICQTERGLEIGLSTADPRELSLDELREHGVTTELKPIIRVATQSDLDYADELAERGERAMPEFRRLAKESGLDIKPVGVEYPFQSDKVVCYFSAEERVDFRQLVRDLSRAFNSRVDMRQIGVREEAALMGGYAHCGQELCCTRFGKQFEPVSIRMAKEQDLPLNSVKISGACGRLMCCLRYEFEAYRDFKSRAPKKNAVIDTPLGKAKIMEYDTPKEQLALRLENGKLIRVPLAGMQASDEAQQKSAELNCPCRPDTVTRSMLEALESPEVQMALAELDRTYGLVPDDDADISEIFADGTHKQTQGDVSQADAQSQAEKDKLPAEPKNQAKRRRSHGQQEQSGAQRQGAQHKHADAHGQQGHAADTSSARTRRRRPGDRGGAAQRKQNSQHEGAVPEQNNKRRRHHGPTKTSQESAAHMKQGVSETARRSQASASSASHAQAKRRHHGRRMRRDGADNNET